jgi:ATP-binding cassette subfamily B protein
MLSFVIGLVLSNVIATLFNALFATRYCTNMRNKFFLKVNNMSFTEVGGFSIPSLITRCTNDSTQFMNTLSSLNILVAAPISII